MVLDRCVIESPESVAPVATRAMVLESARLLEAFLVDIDGIGLSEIFERARTENPCTHTLAQWVIWMFRSEHGHAARCLYDRFQVEAFRNSDRLNVTGPVCDVHSFLPSVEVSTLRAIAEVLHRPEEAVDLAVESVLRQYPVPEQEGDGLSNAWVKRVEGAFNAYGQMVHRAINYYPTPECRRGHYYDTNRPWLTLRNERVIEAAEESVRLAREPGQPALRAAALEHWLSTQAYASEGRLALEARANGIAKVYERKAPITRSLRTVLYLCPEDVGLPLRALAPAHERFGHDGLYLVRTFGTRWLDYLSRKMANPAERGCLYGRPFEAQDESAVRARVDQAVHQAATPIPSGKRRELEGLGDYLMRYDYARNQPWVRQATQAWTAMLPEERALPPQEAYDAFITRIGEAMRETLEAIPPRLAPEILKWLTLGSLAHGESGEVRQARMVERLSHQIRQAGEIYERSLEVPLPSWAHGEYELDGLRAWWLPRDDPRGLVVGHYAECCQYIWGGARDSAIHAQISRHGANFVFGKGGEIFGCAWVFEGADGRVVFDNIENVKALNGDARLLGLAEQAAARMAGRYVTLGTAYVQTPHGHLPKVERYHWSPPTPGADDAEPEIDEVAPLPNRLPLVDVAPHPYGERDHISDARPATRPDFAWWPLEYEWGTYTDARNQVLLADNRYALPVRCGTIQ